MQIQGQVGPVIGSDGTTQLVRLSKEGAATVTDLNGKYYERASRGQLFFGTKTTASAIPATNTTAPVCFLWNPSGNTNNIALVRYAAGWVATTEAPGNILFAVLTNAGSVAATGAPITAFTSATPTNGLLGRGNTSTAIFATSATLTTAGTVFDTLGLSHLTTTGTATFGSFTYSLDFDGMIVIPPGVAIYTVASTATASTYNESFVWYEAPIVA